jgi:hypothetical protein
MSAHNSALDAAREPAALRPFWLEFNALAALAGLFLLAGCAYAPQAPVVGPDPADPGAPTPRVDYRSTVGSYRSQRPVEVRPWDERNEAVTPRPKSGR